MPVIQ